MRGSTIITLNTDSVLVVARWFCPILAAVAALPASEAAAQTAAPTVEASGSWRALFERDIDYLERAIPTYYIYASYPGGAAWDRQFKQALSRARREAAQVKDFPTYRAVLQHFIVSFEDAHFSAYFSVTSRRGRWPGFAVQYRGDRYVVVQSDVPDAVVGAAVESCDGEALNGWVDRQTAFLGGPKGLDSTRATIGQQLFLDDGNPLYRLPVACRVGGRDLVLQWRPLPAVPSRWVPQEAQRTSAPVPTIDDESVSVADFGTNGAWVRIGTMMPTGDQQMTQFRDLIARAPALRDKQVVVVDVRGNSGGVYNWFMGFLRAFYGKSYADYYARARLEITNVIMTPNVPEAADAGVPQGFSMGDMPPDPQMEATAGKASERVLPGGAKLVLTPAPVEALRLPARAPNSLVKAQVYLLTDYGCASACISFVDEMRRFPCVTQIGMETHVDRRSGGWPAAYDLPSGLAVVRMGRMVRENRKRGENEVWAPAIRFSGDIADTEAVKRWVGETVLPVQLQRACRKK